MTTKYYKYRLKCTTDDTYEYWILNENESPPTTCPTNTAHTIDSGSITIVSTISQDVIKIQEESIETGGNYLTESIVITGDTGPNVTTTHNFTWPFPISVLDIQFVSEETNRGDQLSLCVGPDTIIGALTADAPTGATGLDVSQTVVDNTCIGYYINLFTPPSTVEALGRVITVDKVNKKLYCENTTTALFNASGPTYVRQTVYTVNNYTIGAPNRYPIGEGKIGGSYIPANVDIAVTYINNSATPKELATVIEYLY